MGILRHPNGQPSSTPEETATLLLDTHFPNCKLPSKHIPSQTLQPSPPLSWIESSWTWPNATYGPQTITWKYFT
jgi:hypothetical protein